MDLYKKLYVERCIFCEKPSKVIIGVALGSWGNDYGFCTKCSGTRTIRELIDRTQEIVSEFNEDS